MKCEKCGYQNSRYDIICNNCGFPLNIEDNVDLKKLYNNKQRAIDIDELEFDHSQVNFNTTKKRVKITVIFIFIIISILLTIFTGWAIKEVQTSNVIVQVDEFLDKTDYGILYIGNDNKINKQLEYYSVNYEFDYKYISLENVTKIKKEEIKEKFDIKDINSILLIVEDGKVMKHLSNISYNEREFVVHFLQENEVLPKVIGKTDMHINKFNNALKSSTATIMYIANNKHELSEERNNKIAQFCSDYEIEYVYIEGYYLSDRQKLRLLEKLNYSEIHDEIIVIIDEGQIKEVNERITSETSYFDLASQYGIIDIESADSLLNIDFEQFKVLLASNEKNVIMLSTTDCNYCEKLKPIIGKIGIQNNINIYNYEINKNELSIVEEYLKTLDYKEGKLVFPVVLISENNKILDYIIGLSEKTLYEDKFKEFGVIR